MCQLDSPSKFFKESQRASSEGTSYRDSGQHEFWPAAAVNSFDMDDH